MFCEIRYNKFETYTVIWKDLLRALHFQSNLVSPKSDSFVERFEHTFSQHSPIKDLFQPLKLAAGGSKLAQTRWGGGG